MQRRWKRAWQYWILIGMLLVWLMPMRASATQISGIYVFGDSLSDTGNVFQASLLTVGTGLPAPPYFQGRFSNGYLWIDYLAEQLGLQIMPVAQIQTTHPKAVNFAYGGATTGSGNVVNTALPGLQDEIEQFRRLLPQEKADSNALYTFWIGANDYLSQSADGPPKDSTQPAANISAAIQSLYDWGARCFLVVNLPALGETPLAYSVGQERVSTLNRLSQQHNRSLNQQMETLRSLPQIQLIQLDVDQLFRQAIAGQLQFSDLKTPCFDRATAQVCDQPNQHLFWDMLHPTTAAHRHVGDLAAEAIQTQFNRSRVPIGSKLVLVGTLSLLASASAFWHVRRTI
jgi:phospholipase/lecithinase/hemolysin